MKNQKKTGFRSPFPADDVLRGQMLTLAKAYLDASEQPVSLKTLGERIMRDSRFFIRLDEGDGSFTAPKYDQVLIWFAQERAEGRSTMKWPAGIPCPSKAYFKQPEAAE
jgi:hypothetical protein